MNITSTNRSQALNTNLNDNYPMNYIERIPNWEKEYKENPTRKLSKRELELLDGSPIKSHEGMVYGRMYAEWKSQYENK